MKSEFLSVLRERGFINQCTDMAALDEAFSSPQSAYVGFDLTADSLHVGSLTQLMLMRWMARFGHTPIALLGGFTTRIGDPTGRSASRPALSSETIAHNRRGIENAINRLVSSVRVVNNDDWLGQMSITEFFVSFGSHFSVNRMLGMDSVKNRLDAQDGMSVLEFSYSMLQGIDFFHLHQNENCIAQFGGSDQWSNIISGVEIIRRRAGEKAIGLTTPLMTNLAGDKMGKTAQGAVWLDPEKTSPHDFWQFWRNVEDEKVEEFLFRFTELGTDVIDHGMSVNGPGINGMKISLATEVTRIVHGDIADDIAAGQLPVEDFDGGTIAEALLNAGLVSSKGEADRLTVQRGVRIDGIIVTDARAEFPTGTHRVEIGKKRSALIRRQ